jgi:hypothetical protein
MGRKYSRYGIQQGTTVGYYSAYDVNSLLNTDGLVSGSVSVQMERTYKEVVLKYLLETQNFVANRPLTDWESCYGSPNINLIDNDITKGIYFDAEAPFLLAGHKHGYMAGLRLEKVGTISYVGVMEEWAPGTLQVSFEAMIALNEATDEDFKVVSYITPVVRYSFQNPNEIFQPTIQLEPDIIGVLEQQRIWKKFSFTQIIKPYFNYPDSSQTYKSLVFGLFKEVVDNRFQMLMIRNIEVSYTDVGAIDYTADKIPSFHDEKINIDSRNIPILTVEKYYGIRYNQIEHTHDISDIVESYLFSNQIYVLNEEDSSSGDDERPYKLLPAEWTIYGDVINFLTIMNDIYYDFYSKKRFRFNFSMYNQNPDRILLAYTKLFMVQYEFICYVLGFTWNLKLDTYRVEALSHEYYTPAIPGNIVYYGNTMVYHLSAVVVYDAGIHDGYFGSESVS